MYEGFFPLIFELLEQTQVTNKYIWSKWRMDNILDTQIIKRIGFLVGYKSIKKTRFLKGRRLCLSFIRKLLLYRIRFGYLCFW